MPTIDNNVVSKNSFVTATLKKASGDVFEANSVDRFFFFQIINLRKNAFGSF
jgi:hypothetical protein